MANKQTIRLGPLTTADQFYADLQHGSPSTHRVHVYADGMMSLPERMLQFAAEANKDGFEIVVGIDWMFKELANVDIPSVIEKE